MKTHEHRLDALARAIAVFTLNAGGLDDDTRADLLSVASDAGAAKRRDPAKGPDGLHMRAVHVRAVREAERQVDYVASTEAVDSYGEVLRQNWIFTRFDRNPVILWAHNNDWAVPTLPVGRSVRHVVENDQLLITPQFSVKNPFAVIVFDMLVEGMLKAGSVGFKPHKVSRETINGVERTVCDQNELYEFSICPMGANPDALVIESTEERMSKMLEERAKNAVHSIPTARSQRGQNNNPAAAGMRKNVMKIRKLTQEQHEDLGRRGVITHECEECKGVMVLEAPGVVQLAQEHKDLSARAKASEERAKAAEQAKAEAETRAKSAEERATAAESAKTTLTQERDAAAKRADDEKKKADEAISAKAALELGPLTGLDPWQLSPAQAQRLAKRAATDPDGYAADVAETRQKGVAAGALRSDVVERTPDTSKPDEKPPVQQLSSVGDDAALFAEMEKRTAELQKSRAANNTATSLTR
jgi:HK97 family phage prohead protease